MSGLDGAPSQVRLMRIDYATSGMAVDLLWDATSDELITSLPTDESGTICMAEYGGFPNSEATGFTGDLMLTTRGHTAADTYSVTLHMIKKYASI